MIQVAPEIITAFGIAVPGAFGTVLLVMRIIKESKSLVPRTAHERHGTRVSDDVKVSREQIEKEINEARMLIENHEKISSLVEDNTTFSQVLERLSENLEGIKRSNELITGLVDISVKKVEIMAIQIQNLMSAGASKDEIRELRHGIANYRQEIADIVEHVRMVKKGL